MVFPQAVQKVAHWVEKTAASRVAWLVALMAVWKASSLVSLRADNSAALMADCLAYGKVVSRAAYLVSRWVFRQAERLAVLTVAWMAWLVVVTKVVKRVALRVLPTVAMMAAKWVVHSACHSDWSRAAKKAADLVVKMAALKVATKAVLMAA